MIVRIVMPALALAMATYAALFVVREQKSATAPEYPGTPVVTPFAAAVCGVGIVESESEDIGIGSALPGTVVEVLVSENQEVSAQDPLLRIDDRDRIAQLRVREAALEIARRKLARMESLPRTEELPAKAQKVRECRAQVEYHENHLKRTSDLFERKAFAKAEFESAVRSLQVAHAQLATAEAEYALLEAGAWQPDLALARAEVQMASAELARVQCEIERLTIRAPIAGRILQANVRVGEYVATPSTVPLFVIGQTDRLHVRVEIDDRDLDRLRTECRAVAMTRGRSRRQTPLSFVRTEPYVVPKQSLHGGPREQVDTRVLQVIYQIVTPDTPLYVGQEVDVFIEASE